jgi:di/tricarboxylate transporter
LQGYCCGSLVSKAAFDIFDIQFDWFTWAKGGIVPGLIGLAGLPLLINYISTPTIDSIQPIREKIQEDIQSLGPWTRQEIITACTLGVMLIL